MKLLSLVLPAALGLLSATEGLAQERQASIIANCRSIALAQNSGLLPGYGTVYNRFTTYDGSTGVPLHDVVNGSWKFSEELRPRAGQPAVYDADYVTYNASGAYIQYGSITLHAPTTDSDGNGLPDIAQRNGSVAEFVGNSI